MTTAPGERRYEWETRYAALEDDLRTAPADALPELLRLVEEMLAAAGYDTGAEDVPEAPEAAAALRRARELVTRGDSGEAVANDDAFQAAAELRAVYRGLIVSPEIASEIDRSS